MIGSGARFHAMRRAYGAGPVHLVGHLLSLAAIAYALSQVIGSRYAPQTINYLLWLIGGAVLHDLVGLPIYSAIDRGLQRISAIGRARGVPAINHLRVPAVVCGVVLLVDWPRILNKQPGNYVNALGRQPPDYALRFGLFTLAAFALSAAAYAARVMRSERPVTQEPS